MDFPIKAILLVIGILLYYIVHGLLAVIVPVSSEKQEVCIELVM